MYQFTDSDTICAISTPAGTGGIAVIRISGNDAINIVNTVWRGKPIDKFASHTAHLGEIVDPTKPDEPIDTAVATLFRGPRSFTGENVVELSVHGSQWIQRELVNLLIRSGCRLAQAGEFTRRAFTNGRLDLAQAEAVADVIAASSRSAHRLAALQMRGTFSKEISELRDKLIEIASLLELELDFSEEDVEFASRQKLRTLAEKLHSKISRLADSFSTGSAIKNGVPVAIVGEPNAGKSTLLNTLLNDNRAIVSDIPGTTRDTIEDTIEIGGILYRFIDTAGIRETGDIVENLGIERSYAAISKARTVIWVVTPDLSPIDYNSIRSVITRHLSADAHLIVAINKIDTLSVADIKRTENLVWDTINDSGHNDDTKDKTSEYHVAISAKTGENISTLKDILKKSSGAEDTEEDVLIVTNARHYEALTNARASLQRVIAGIDNDISGDFIAQDLRETIHHLSTITGTITTTDLLHEIFNKFCIGK
ncbi:MAG: tRNA uridine-5-carboxymethylaminomethyl(34) synthesis GTPase MnmE [Bacteroides sp.]|nr:tRNA uridine-5-carboxymethylaminomethyl(34) synthesis GTPase MnmE [Bacteroides sp.]